MTGAPALCTFRLARAADAASIAALHTASWRAHYRGSMSDAFLDGELEPERHRLWSERFAAPQSGQRVVLGEDAQGLIGFACAFADHDPTWGTLIDNLHVTVERKGRGLGRALMRETAHHLADMSPGRPVHLFVLDANRAAQAFYRHLGGIEIDRDRHVMPDGSDNAVIGFSWSSPAALLGATTPS